MRSRNLRQKREYAGAYYLIVVDTRKTEANYLIGLKNSLPHNNIELKIIEAKTHGLIGECINNNSPQYKEKWIVFDYDNREAFDEIIQTARALDINVGWSNPCIEIWFHAYFGKMPPCLDSKKCIDNFSVVYSQKTKQEYKKNDESVYNKLCSYGNEQNAIALAKNRASSYSGNQPSKMQSCTTLHNLVERLKTE